MNRLLDLNTLKTRIALGTGALMVTTAVIAIVAILALGRLRGIGTEVTRTTLSSEVAAKLAAAVSV